MRTNGEFGKFLYELKPQGNQSLLALYNYIRTYSEINAPFSPETIFNFYIKALFFEHWQKNAIELSQATTNVLFKFLGDQINSREWSNLKKPENIQIIKIKDPRDQVDLIKNYLTKKNIGLKKLNCQIFKDKNSIVHAVIVEPSGKILVQSFDDSAFVLNGQVVPLIQDRKLCYDKNLELEKNTLQQIQISSFITAQFKIQQDMIIGDYIRGYTFQSFQRIELHGFHQDSNILHALKKIERFFIDRSTEPLYLELIQVLEQTLDFLRRDVTGSHELGKKAYVRGQNALENIFVDDKMLMILLDEMHSLLGYKGNQSWTKTSSESTNTSLNQASALEEPPINSLRMATFKSMEKL